MLQKLRMRMELEIVEFTYLKQNGEIRVARGTLRRDLCPTIVGGGRQTPEHLQLYFDVDKGAWRSFNKDRFIKMH